MGKSSNELGRELLGRVQDEFLAPAERVRALDQVIVVAYYDMEDYDWGNDESAASLESELVALRKKWRESKDPFERELSLRVSLLYWGPTLESFEIMLEDNPYRLKEVHEALLSPRNVSAIFEFPEKPSIGFTEVGEKIVSLLADLIGQGAHGLKCLGEVRALTNSFSPEHPSRVFFSKVEAIVNAFFHPVEPAIGASEVAVEDVLKEFFSLGVIELKDPFPFESMNGKVFFSLVASKEKYLVSFKFKGSGLENFKVTSFAGLEFQVVNEDCRVLGTFVTDEKDKRLEIDIRSLPPGRHFLKFKGRKI